MSARGGFNSYMVAPGLTSIEKVRAVLARIEGGERAKRRLESDLLRAGLDVLQATSLVRWAISEAERAAA